MSTETLLPDAVEPDELPDEIEPEEAETPVAIEPEIVPADQEQALARQSTDIVSRAKALQITDVGTFEAAGEMLQALKDKARQIEEFFEADIQRAHAAWKGLTTKRASFLDPLKEAIAIVSSRYATFAQEEKRKAEAERRRRELEEQERERARLKAEADARAAEAARLVEEAMQATSRDEALALEEQAAAAKVEAEEIRHEAATVQAPVLPLAPTVTPPKGVSVRSNWKHEVTDIRALVKAVAEGSVPINAIAANDTYLGQRARADKGTVPIPGVRFYDAGSVANRRR